MRRLIVGLVVVLGCDAGPPSTVSALVSTWKAAELTPGAFAPVDGKPLGGGSCQRGEVSELEVTVCELADPAAAEAQERAGLAMVGAATGAAIAEGKLLVVVADRQGKDPDGKKIDRLTRALRGK